MRFILQNRKLIKRLMIRDIQSRYKSTMLGMLWVFVTPLLMLSIYAFIFSTVLKAKWPNSSESQFEFALILYCGLIVFNLFSEFLSRAPNLILENVNYVKKVIFPIEILPVILLGSALFQALINYGILLVFCLIFYGSLQWTILLLPLILMPFLLLLLGLGMALSSLGVYIRDIGQFIGVIITGLMFISPLFFPLTALPEYIRPYLYLNPVTFIIEQVREIIIWGHMPDWSGLLIYSVASLLVVWLVYTFFSKTRKGFSDVL